MVIRDYVWIVDLSHPQNESGFRKRPRHLLNLICLPKVDFGPHFFGEELVRTVQLFNNGPVEGRFMISYGTPAEIKARIEEAEGNGPGADADDPYSGFMMAARQKVRRRGA